MNKYLSGTYRHKTGTRPPSCATPRQPTIYVTGFPYETDVLNRSAITAGFRIHLLSRHFLSTKSFELCKAVL